MQTVDSQLNRDRFDAKLGVVLTMALTLLVMLATAHLEDLHLVMPALCKNCCLDRSACYQRCANFQLVTFANRQNLV